MAFNGNEGGFISLEDGADMTRRYRDENPNEVLGHFYGINKLNKLLKQEGAVGIRMYHGIDENGEKQMVLVATDSEQNDILDLVLDLNHPCPTECGSPNDLNS